jgi:serine/threonine protein kinase
MGSTFYIAKMAEVPMHKEGIALDIAFIGRYKINGVLGAGGQNHVLDVVDSRSGMPCAGKVVFGFGHDEDWYAQGVGRLASARRAFKETGFHDYILRYLDGGDTLVDAALEGGRLKIPCYFNVGEKVDLAPIPDSDELDFPEGFSPQEVARIGAEAASALIAMHEKGWVHLDVKPENLFIDKEGHVHLGDLGLAYQMKKGFGDDGSETYLPCVPNLVGHETLAKVEEGCCMGSPRYMSPEQSLTPYAGPEADIYGLGASLYTMAAGKHPFDGDNAAQIIFRARYNPALPLRLVAKVPKRLSNIVEKMMQKKPENRGDLRQLEIDLRKASTERNESPRSFWNLWKFWDSKGIY